MASELSGARGELGSLTNKEGLLKIIACHSSIKAGETVSPEEMKRLMEDLLQCSNPYFCPHGRPAAVKFDGKDLEKLFKRKGV
jgi:DNA mismatch repair protein MutL